jgi:hypothetical protein
MKKILLFIVLLIGYFTSFAQNDSTKYVHYKFQYGSWMDRYRADKVLMLPADTSYSKDGIARLNGKLFLGDGSLWHQVAPDVLATGNTFIVNSQAAMLALDTAKVGDIAIRSDSSKSFILQSLPSSTLSNWVQLLFPASVNSVFGRTGVITAQSGDYDAFYLSPADTVGRWVQNIYSRNDSLFQFKNGVETFIKSGLSQSTVDSILGGYYTRAQVDSIVAQFSSIDSSAYHTIGQAADSSYFTIITPDGRVDTVRFVGESGGGAADRFGIEDNTGVQDRYINMQSKKLQIDSLNQLSVTAYNTSYSNTLYFDPSRYFTGLSSKSSQYSSTADLGINSAHPYFNIKVVDSLYGQGYINSNYSGLSSLGKVQIGFQLGGQHGRQILIDTGSVKINYFNGITGGRNVIFPSIPSADRYIPLSVNNQFADNTGNVQLSQLKVTTKSTDPTTTDIADGYSAVYKNSTSGNVYLWANIGGTLYKTQLL